MPKQVYPTAAAFMPEKRTLPSLREAATVCKGCDLWKSGTQTVFGEGNPHARVFMVGEQPGDKEDIQGRPFVGPAGAVLDKALQAAGIDRDDVYVTNIVKHFKWEPRGKRRIHKKPSALEISACRPWLDAEIEVARPEVVVLLGASAAQGLLGRDFRVSQQRGQWVRSGIAPVVMATVHPSSILRAPDDESRHEEMRKFVADLKKVAARLRLPKAA
ncbi:MAG TPA: UdgX family uracil-DNA binding protein [Candidatus Acidoferrales bacterium]|jgi:uracil-DNA glycosylase family protein|nr:UdgX family uracil-DNA binding protein [Candidatus Acidoferrales bacterium]